MKRKGWLVTNYLCVFMLAMAMHVSANVFSQQEKIVFTAEKLSVEKIFDLITSQLKYDVFYSENDLDVTKEVVMPQKTMEVREVLEKVLGRNFQYSVVGKTIVISPQRQAQIQVGMMTITGVVKDKKGGTLPGVTVRVKGTSLGAASDVDGNFKMSLPKMDNVVLIFSFVGMKNQEVAYKEKPLTVVMEEEAASLDEVVVTGIFQRKAESFTGSAATYKAKDLQMVGRQNVLQSLRTLDPAFHISESRDFGSDPNRLPDMDIRGKTSVVGLKQQFGADPNQPLFILDGFETTLQTVVDLNMERVESITLLKDAASTAIYGSRAANGVVVIETKKPVEGELQVSYTGDIMLSIPDLSDYNLMNSSEKLQYEQLAGVYTPMSHVLDDPESWFNLDQVYQERKARVASGVDSYWMSDPLRTAFTHKHNLYIQGGDRAVRYGLGVNYGNTQGVMEKSGNQVFSGNLSLMYRKKKLSFNNRLTLNYRTTNDPVVSFDQYAKVNPYYIKTTENLYLEKESSYNPAKRDVYNPLYDASLNNTKKSSTIGVVENFEGEWNPVESFKMRARFGMIKEIQNTENSLSPNHSSFAKISDVNKKGDYGKQDMNSYSYNGDVTLTYGAVLGAVHRINAVGGWSFSDATSEVQGFSVIGFPGDLIMNPAFGNQYPENSKPVYMQNRSRATSFFANLGYAYDERYLLDANIRMDGSSVFGSSRMFTTTWSGGLSWNIHNEAFLKDNSIVNLLKIRASVGNPGNQGFGGYNTYTTYVYNTLLYNANGVGAVIDKFGNPDLKWQKTLDMNLGADVTMFNSRLKFNLDVYKKKTDPLLVAATIPASVGVTTFTTNTGYQTTRGVSASLFYSPIYRMDENINWVVNANVRVQHSEYGGIGNSLDNLNMNQRGSSLSRYYDGGSPSAIWAVRSAGIDPMTGKEIYIKKDGEYTFEHDYGDEVEIGNTDPQFEGVIGTSLYWKGLTVSVSMRYRINADVFNSALYEKVENITRDNWQNNLDRRALTDRWQKPGDKAQFKGIALADKVDPMSSRFVQRENTLAGESISVGYEFLEGEWLQQCRLKTLSMRAYMNDIFRLSTIKAERGIQYPFARSVSFSLSATF